MQRLQFSPVIPLALEFCLVQELGRNAQTVSFRKLKASSHFLLVTIRS